MNHLAYALAIALLAVSATAQAGAEEETGPAAQERQPPCEWLVIDPTTIPPTTRIDPSCITASAERTNP